MDKRTAIRKASQAQETAAAKAVGGRVQPASGAVWHSKGDVSSDDFLIECKLTAARSYRLTLDTLLKIEREAVLAGKDFALWLDIAGRGYVVVDTSTFLALIDGQP